MHSTSSRRFTLSALLALIFAASPGASLRAQGPVPVADPESKAAFEALSRATRGRISAHVAKETRNFDFVLATGGAVLLVDDTSASPEDRALSFLSRERDLLGIRVARPAEGTATLSTVGPELKVRKVERDALGQTHVRLEQVYRGVPVFGAELVVHMNGAGILGVNGAFVPGIELDTTPRVAPAAAAAEAQVRVAKEKAAGNPAVASTRLMIYRTGLLEGFFGENKLTWAVEVTAPAVRELVFLDAITGAFVNRVSLKHEALYREIYSPQLNPAFLLRKEGDPPSPAPEDNPVDRLYDYAGETYAFFQNGFGRDSFDAAGGKMMSVYLVNEKCPNAYWNSTATHYCPTFDDDDVVSHEWGHAYTEHTHDLVYAYQSGALNESYSDFWGETIDLNNGHDGIGGANNAEPAPDGQRWLIGEDIEGLGPLRDMWDPTQNSDPDRVGNTEFYHCTADDGGGVHTNSGVPNHAYAMIVDGKTFNGQTVAGIGFVKAAHVYFRAMTTYQTKTTNFVGHANALEQACADLQLAQTNLRDPFTGALSGQVISSSDCGQVRNAMLAVEMRDDPPCGGGLILQPGAPAACEGASTVFSEDFESGLDGWAFQSVGISPAEWPNYNWQTVGELPAARPGSAAFAPDPVAGSCTVGSGDGDHSGKFSMTSPAIMIPAGATNVELRFDHSVETEAGWDGGNLLYSTNGVVFQLVPQSAYVFNAPNTTLNPTASETPNTNPKAGEPAWSGVNQGVTFGSWGTTVVNLSALASPGTSVWLRFEAGQDGCNGVTGWFVDALQVTSCPNLAPPVLSIGAGYENPDTNGSYSLDWTRPAGATGPDTLQESQSCGAILSDNAENGFTQWDRTGTPPWQTGQAKPQHSSNIFFVEMPEFFGGDITMTTKSFLALPATGATAIRWRDWNVNEPDDAVFVEVSEDGASWTAVYTSNRNAKAQDGAAALATEPLAPRKVDLSAYNGKSIKVRFRFFAGALNWFEYSPLGWYVDDISITNDSFADVVSTPGTTAALTGRAPGIYCYRVRTSYAGLTSPYSNVVNVQVGAGTVTPPVAPSQNAIQDDAAPDQVGGVDKDGRYRLSWTYAAPPVEQPCGGFRIEEATAFGAVFADDGSQALVAGANSRWTGDPQWISAPHPDTGTLGYSLVYVDNLNVSLTMANALAVPANSAARLTFASFEDIEEDFDYGFVEVSANGGAFQTLATYSGIFSGERSIDLSPFAGQSIRVRFRVTSDNIISFPLHLGWFIDDIAVSASNFAPIATVPASTLQYDRTVAADGTYYYRVAGLFGVGCATLGPWSNVQQIAVERGPMTYDPSAGFAASPNPANVNQTVTFDGTASHDNDAVGTSPEITRYFWAFGDGSSQTTTSATTTHAYSAAGTYRATLTVTDNDGETASAEALIEVSSPPPPGSREASGGGHIAVGGEKANFGFDAEASVAGTSGHLTYHDKAGDKKVHSQSITSLVVTGNRATIQGTCTVNKVSGFTFTVDVIDNGPSGSGDTFRIRLSNGYDAGGALGGGNITVK